MCNTIEKPATEVVDPDRIARLPKWAQRHIAELEERASASGVTAGRCSVHRSVRAFVCLLKRRSLDAFERGKLEPEEMGRKLIEHGAWCYFNAARELESVITPPSAAGGISSANAQAALLGIISLHDCTPDDGQCVVWLWDKAGQITAGDYFDGKCRDAAKNYAEIDTQPTHWMPWPSNWPNALL